MKFHFWYTILSLFFIALAVFGYEWLAASDQLPWGVSLPDFFLMALAVTRLVRLVTYDIITKFARDWFSGADPLSLRGTVGALLNCPWCTGLWFSLFVVFFYFAIPVIAWYAILVLALATVASFFQLIAQYVAWSTEVKKGEAQSFMLPR